MKHAVDRSPGGRRPGRTRLQSILGILLLIAFLLPASGSGAQGDGSSTWFDPNVDPEQWYQDHEIEHSWTPGYLHLATGDPTLSIDHGVYEWPFDLDSIGWSMQSYQYYGGTPYFHHGMDMMKIYGTEVFNRSGGQVINIENYVPGNSLYWEVAVLDPDGYIWQYHHIDQPTIPAEIYTRWYEYLADPEDGGFIDPDTYVGDIVYWPVWSFGKQFNHIHLNILAEGGVYVNGFEFHVPLPDMVGPEIQGVGLLKNGEIHPGDSVEGEYSLYVRARDLVLDDVYYLPPWEINFSVDCGPVETTWRFDTLPGGADRYAYLDDFYVVPLTCGDYGCRDYYIDLGFIPDSQFQFPTGDGQHMVDVTVRDYNGNEASQSYIYTVIGPPNSPPVADPQSLSTPEDTPVDILLTGSDPDSDPLTFTVVSTPTHGILGGIAPDLVYTPALDYNGADSFTFIVSDCLGSSEPALVEIEVTPVNDPPVADPQSVSTPEDTPVGILLTGSDPDGDPITFIVVSTPTHGMLGGTAPDLVYTPTLNYNGPDSFTFIVSDGLESSQPALVEIEVTPVNDPPVAVPQSLSTPEDTPVDILLAGSDPDGDPLSFTVVSTPTHGILGGIAPSLVYTPNLDYNGPDSFTFFVSDGLESSEPALVEIEVTPVNDPPALNAIGDQAAMVGDLLTFTASASDVDGDTLTFSLDPGAPEGAAIDAVSGVFTWIPGAGGVFTAIIRVRDGGSPVLEDAETINIIVTAQPNFPIYLPVLIRP